MDDARSLLFIAWATVLAAVLVAYTAKHWNDK